MQSWQVQCQTLFFKQSYYIIIFPFIILVLTIVVINIISIALTIIIALINILIVTASTESLNLCHHCVYFPEASFHQQSVFLFIS